MGSRAAPLFRQRPEFVSGLRAWSVVSSHIRLCAKIQRDFQQRAEVAGLAKNRNQEGSVSKVISKPR